MAAAPGEYKLNLEGDITYIASQRNYTCIPDSIQTILTLADGFRQLNAYKAQELFNKYPKRILEYAGKERNFDDEYLVDIAKFLNLSVGPENNAMILYYAGMLRRFILIRLNECGYTIQGISREFKVDVTSIQTACPLQIIVPGTLERQTSINEKAGAELFQIVEEDTRGPVLHKEKGKGLYAEQTSLFIQKLFRLKDNSEKFDYHFLSNLPEVRSIASTQSPINHENIVGILISVKSHVTCIIRYRNEFYYADNEIGKILKLNIKPDDLKGIHSNSIGIRRLDTELKGIRYTELMLVLNGHTIYNSYKKNDYSPINIAKYLAVFTTKGSVSLGPPTSRCGRYQRVFRGQLGFPALPESWTQPYRASKAASSPPQKASKGSSSPPPKALEVAPPPKLKQSVVKKIQVPIAPANTILNTLRTDFPVFEPLAESSVKTVIATKRAAIYP
jgi:hypothetical protein